MKFTYAIIVSKMLIALITPTAQDLIDLNAKFDVKPYGYQLGTNAITGKDEVALPHVTLVQFHTTEENFKTSLVHTAQILATNPTLMPSELVSIGYHYVPINPVALKKDEPDLPKRLFWCDVDVRPSDAAPLHIKLVEDLKSIDPNIAIYNANGANYRPHFTLARVKSDNYDSLIAKRFPIDKIASENLKLVAAESTPSGMLYQSRIKYEYDFTKKAWVEYKPQ